jgi:hypothetical protein
VDGRPVVLPFTIRKSSHIAIAEASFVARVFGSAGVLAPEEDESPTVSSAVHGART